MALKQHLAHKLEQRLSPQQIQLMKLLQVPTMELDQRIKQEIEENPALEEGSDEEEDEYGDDLDDDYDDNDDDLEFDISDYIDEEGSDYKTKANNTSKDDEERIVPLSGEQSFQERLIEQLHLLDLDDTQFMIADTIIGNLDESGYLKREVEALVDDLAFALNVTTTEKEVEAILMLIQELDPAGVGARDLQECLLIQIKRKQDGDITKFTAKVILEQFFEEFTKKHYDKISKKLEIEDQDLKEAVDEILKLNPKPGGSMKESAKNHQQIIPDFMIVEMEGRLDLSLNGRNAPELKVSREYEQMLRNYAEGAKTSKSDKEALVFVKQKLDGAKWFIDAIRQRQHTLLMTMDTIMNYQREYFLTGDETNLKPMILKDIAEIVGLDISTISRVANSKYVQTGFGVFPLKYFFSESLSTDSGEEVSTREVKKILSDAIEAEVKKKPLTDEKLMDLLKEKGYNIARRTVAKYREQLNIPVARLRKEL
ncbi:MAG: RNA polymerase factor sigma-54 [Crocinitomicaceae bacterium]|nr:RNA polymerase factor sigma-54 [Crocinitomicaceae bacterium]MCF8433941.1 RNA polymerase factor sigma-54 [Crocinitomicaceae bacterium]MDP4683323.1 RNA polymerase factor sigma-54 [Crocinitomicaceae bacterium]MDP4866041.1 RNA polymerase factor sigma-54 [Crocinitomicaceae bacterium]MDP5009932.1 RNA polymerase factor sigma-54 [Crocinitomicaceae bacterium]